MLSVARSWRVWMRLHYLQFPIGKRLGAMMGLAAAVSVLLAGMGIAGLAASNESLRSVYEDRMVPVRELSRIHGLFLSNRLILQSALSSVHTEAGRSGAPVLVMNRDAAQAAAASINRNIQVINDQWQAYASKTLAQQEAAQAARFEQVRQGYLEDALVPAVVALRANNYPLTQRAADQGRAHFEVLASQLEHLIDLQFALADAGYQAGVERYRNTRFWALVALAASMLTMGGLGWMLIRSIVRPLERVINTFRQISLGHYDTRITIEGSDEISKVMQALQAMQTKLGSHENAIHQLAFYDPLTNLPNRRLLRDRLQLALGASARSQTYGAILMIDLDDFKIINDTQGHDVGDDLLVEMAQRLKGCLRQADTVARLGGDEFVVMLVNLGPDANLAAVQAEGVGEKILQAIVQPCMLGQQSHQSSASIGITLFVDQSATIDELLKRADLAMYQAKNNGRNTQRFFDPRIQAALEVRLGLELELRNALPQGQFELYYQVQVDSEQDVLGAEVLLRWRHPTRGMVGPVDFIPIAEESGLIVPIGEWVLRGACEQLKRWEDDPLTAHWTLSVNVSARQFRQPDFVPMVRRLLEQTGINTRRLKLELTESLVLDNVADTILKMKLLNQRGIQFSMDDFGTGHSSLSQLNQLPISQLKIDRSFVSHMVGSRNDSVIVQTIIGMARNLHLNVIAEGVETEEQRALLEQFGCPAYQGYLAGRPMPLNDFVELARRKTRVPA
ncbi:MAG: EAL domain-containing protein [Rhodoferax sp.]